jgi:glycogen synthase
MKVLLVVSSYAPNAGGLQTVTRHLAKDLSGRGHEVTVITNRYPRTLLSRESIDGIEVNRWHFLAPQLRYLLNLRIDLFLAGLLYLPLTLLKLGLRIRKSRPDVVNLQFIGAPALFVLLARWLVAFRLVVSLHGDDVEGLTSRYVFDRWLFRRLAISASSVTACSRYLLGEAIKFEPIVATKGYAVYNGMEAPVQSSERSESNGVVAAGRMIPKKGFDVLLEAHALSDKDKQLTLIGDGPDREELERLARRVGLNGEVQFKGGQQREQVLAEMAGADLVVVPSRQEPFGMVALEAMALGKPIVASRVGGLPEVLEATDSVLVDPGEPAQLAAAIASVRATLQSEPSFGQRNRELAARFSIQRMTDGYLEAYGA